MNVLLKMAKKVLKKVFFTATFIWRFFVNLNSCTWALPKERDFLFKVTDLNLPTLTMWFYMKLPFHWYICLVPFLIPISPLAHGQIEISGDKNKQTENNKKTKNPPKKPNQNNNKKIKKHIWKALLEIVYSV